MEGWITAFIHRKKKAPASVAFIADISELLDNMAKKSNSLSNTFSSLVLYL